MPARSPASPATRLHPRGLADLHLTSTFDDNTFSVAHHPVHVIVDRMRRRYDRPVVMSTSHLLGIGPTYSRRRRRRTVRASSGGVCPAAGSRAASASCAYLLLPAPAHCMHSQAKISTSICCAHQAHSRPRPARRCLHTVEIRREERLTAFSQLAQALSLCAAQRCDMCSWRTRPVGSKLIIGRAWLVIDVRVAGPRCYRRKTDVASAAVRQGK